ncbi:hypothetical protein VZT92_008288 [Zoarces viviparus]|uniref:Uncharacterized protein n=1 Tax=Zoarces viviparus TaxID=48416 RepID=A0AAW1FEM0_ZOAVI
MAEHRGQTDGRQQPRRDVFDRAAAPGAAHKKDLQSKAPGREQWAKCRLSQFSFTQQLAGNQQVGMLSTPHGRTEGNLTTARPRGTTCRQMIKIVREPIKRRCDPKPLCWRSVLLEHLFDTFSL